MNIKRLIIWFWLLVKKTLRTPLMAVLLMSMPIASCIGLGVTTGTFDRIACVSQNGDKSERPSAALYVCDNDDVAVKIADNLCQLNSVVRYYVVDDKDTFYNDVRSGVADFGYIFRDRLTERLDNKSYRGVILPLSLMRLCLRNFLRYILLILQLIMLSRRMNLIRCGSR